jgi:hypothetical protein
MTDEPKLLRVPQRFASPAEALACAAKMGLPNVLILSELEDGSLVFLEAPDLDLAHCNWLLDRMKTLLLMPDSFSRK